MTESQKAEIRNFISHASAPSFEMMGKGHLLAPAPIRSHHIPEANEVIGHDGYRYFKRTD